jgi:glycosidase
LNVKAQSADSDSLLNHYRRLIALRAAHPALRSLAYQGLESADRSVHAYLRFVEGDAVLVVLNFGDEATAHYALGSPAISLLPGRYKATDLMTGGEVAPLMVEQDGSISTYQPLPELPARGALVLQLVAEGQ